MATFLDVTGLEHFSSVFVFLFVWLVVYAILVSAKVLGGNKFISAILGLVIGVFVLISPISTRIVGRTAPFIAVVVVLIFLITIAIKMLTGETTGHVSEGFHGLGSVVVILIVVIIVVNAVFEIRESVNVPAERQTDFSKTLNLIFHPTFLGMVLILGIAIFTITLLTSRSA